MTFARHQFELAQPQDDGESLLAHLQTYERVTGKAHEMLADAPALPSGLERLWGDFLELHDSRGSTGFGAARITFADIDSWQRVRGETLSPFDVDAIRRADNAWLADFAPKPKASS